MGFLSRSKKKGETLEQMLTSATPESRERALELAYTVDSDRLMAAASSSPTVRAWLTENAARLYSRDIERDRLWQAATIAQWARMPDEMVRRPANEIYDSYMSAAKILYMPSMALKAAMTFDLGKEKIDEAAIACISERLQYWNGANKAKALLSLAGICYAEYQRRLAMELYDRLCKDGEFDKAEKLPKVFGFHGRGELLGGLLREG